MGGLQIAFTNLTQTILRTYVLKFLVCRPYVVKVVQLGTEPKAVERIDPELLILPYLEEHKQKHQTGNQVLWSAFLQDRAEVARLNARSPRRGFQLKLSPTSEQFQGNPYTLQFRFKASDWPKLIEDAKALFSESIKILLEKAES